MVFTGFMTELTFDDLKLYDRYRKVYYYNGCHCSDYQFDGVKELIKKLSDELDEWNIYNGNPTRVNFFDIDDVEDVRQFFDIIGTSTVDFIKITMRHSLMKYKGAKEIIKKNHHRDKYYQNMKIELKACSNIEELESWMESEGYQLDNMSYWKRISD